MSLCEDGYFHHAPCDLVETVKRAVDDLRDAALARLITLDFELIGQPCQVQGDAAHLYHSVLNLVDNAIRYSLARAKVDVSLIFWTNDIHIRVRDTGPGIPEDILSHLFDRYYQGQPASGDEAGIGLGLEVVRATVEAHRGTISARNVPNYGAEFEITLPGSLRIL
jgi:signal transduction histidine kinase